MPFTPKDWRDAPGDTTTPVNAAALEDLETRLSAYTDSVVAGGGIAIPTGIVQWTAAVTAPGGWLAADGTAVSRTTYAGLYAALGGGASPYGQGNGTTTFNLPDLRDRAALGSGSAHALGATGGAATVTLTTGQLPSHSHTGPSHTHAGPSHTHPSEANGVFVDSLGSGGTAGIQIGSTGYKVSSATGAGGTGATGSGGTGATGTAGSGSSHENLPPYLALLPIIKT